MGKKSGPGLGSGGGLRVLGIDPGVAATGWGVVEDQRPRFVCLGSGVISPRGDGLPAKLAEIYRGVNEAIEQWRPRVLCVEKIFIARNVQSALKLGEVRGVVTVVAALCGLKVVEFSPAEIKVAVTGYGRADKGQMQCMVGKLLGLPGPIESDRADALAAAICCLQGAPLAGLLENAGGRSRSWRRLPLRGAAHARSLRR